MGGRTPHEGPSFPRVEVTGITLTKTRQTDSAAWDFFVAHCEAEGITIREAGSGTIAAAMTAYADAATSTLLDEIKARVRGLLVDDPNWIEAGVPDAAIEAGIAAWDQAKHDMENYVSGETADWDEGMIVAAIFKAVGRASILAAIDTIQGRE